MRDIKHASVFKRIPQGILKCDCDVCEKMIMSNHFRDCVRSYSGKQDLEALLIKYAGGFADG
jgi:hypothetical protein